MHLPSLKYEKTIYMKRDLFQTKDLPTETNHSQNLIMKTDNKIDVNIYHPNPKSQQQAMHCNLLKGSVLSGFVTLRV